MPAATSTPTATEAPKATPAPTEVTPTVTGPTEDSKAKVREQMPTTLTSINTDITALKQPFSSNVQPEEFKEQQTQVAASIKAINEALSKNDIATARVSLLDLKNQLYNMRNPSKSIVPTKQMKAEHDPKDKYMQTFPVDPDTMKWYIPVIDMLVATDPAY
jgi:hypothetical protein